MNNLCHSLLAGLFHFLGGTVLGLDSGSAGSSSTSSTAGGRANHCSHDEMGLRRSSFQARQQQQVVASSSVAKEGITVDVSAFGDAKHQNVMHGSD